MSISALILATGVATTLPPAAARRDVEVAAARVQVRIVRAVVVRQLTGLEDPGADAPRPQITRRNGELLVEFE